MTERPLTHYADPRVPQIDAELRKYSVAIVPVEDTGAALPVANPLEQGSGTCIRIDGRFFVATAAHVVPNFPSTRYAVLTPSTTDWVLRVLRGGRRGGGVRDELDVAWLELAPRAAAAAGRHFLDLSRLAPYRDGAEEDLCVYGAPVQDRQSGKKNGRPSITAVASMWATRAMTGEEIGEVDRERRLHLLWPRMVMGHNENPYEYPEAPGLSGGAIWSVNTRAHGEAWRADQAQLIGIEFAAHRARGYRYLIGQQIHIWLEMVAADLPELAPTIDPYLAGARFALKPTRAL